MQITRNDRELELELNGTFVPGCREIGPRYSHGGLPAEPDTYEDIHFKILTPGCEDLEVELTEAEYEKAIEELLALNHELRRL
jgi:hypothetical protein